MNRRHLLIAVPALVLAGCNSTGTVDVTQAIADAGIVVNGVANVYQSFVTLYPKSISPAQQATIAADLAAARTALSNLSANASNLTNLAGLQGVETAINEVLSIMTAVLPGIPGVPPEITAGVMAASVLLPIIEATINALQGAPPKVAAVRGGMSAERARAVLRGVR